MTKESPTKIAICFKNESNKWVNVRFLERKVINAIYSVASCSNPLGMFSIKALRVILHVVCKQKTNFTLTFSMVVAATAQGRWTLSLYLFRPASALHHSVHQSELFKLFVKLPGDVMFYGYL